MAGGDIPEGMRSDARETWPSPELIDSWLGGSFDLSYRAGEDVVVDADDPQAVAAARRFRDTLGQFASGVTVVTAISGGAPIGMTCQSFSSVSLDPPLVLFVPSRTSRAWSGIWKAGRFCVNFLSSEQAWLSNQMASKSDDKFAGVSWEPTAVTGSPLLHDSLAHVDCTIHAVHEAGDHHVVIGRVQNLAVGAEADPLLFFRGQYRSTG